jgi:hypothetical protein
MGFRTRSRSTWIEPAGNVEPGRPAREGTVRGAMPWGSAILPQIEHEPFDEWYRAPGVYDCPEPLLEMRRVRADEFDAVWDLIDVGFASKRSRAMFDWLYRSNPGGLARCCVAVERSTGRFVATTSDFPWSAARGPRAIRAIVAGDQVVHPDWRGRRTSLLLVRYRSAHPRYANAIRINWPNARSRHVLQRDGRGDEIAGWLRHALLPIRPAEFLLRHRVPRSIALAVGRTWETRLTWQLRRWTHPPAGVTAFEIRRFDAAFDSATARAAAWPGYWCPHRADFLNWRYLEHPVHSYVARAVVAGNEPVGYTVVRTDGRTAVLMEFVVPSKSPQCARFLLGTAVDIARHAGCPALAVHAPPSWPHWRVVCRAGFWDRSPTIMLQVKAFDAPDAQHVDAWRLSCGDVDGL